MISQRALQKNIGVSENAIILTIDKIIMANSYSKTFCIIKLEKRQLYMIMVDPVIKNSLLLVSSQLTPILVVPCLF